MIVSDQFPHDRSYAGMPISEVFSSNIGLGGVLSLLWFRRRLPDYATKFIEMILMVRHQTIPISFVLLIDNIAVTSARVDS